VFDGYRWQGSAFENSFDTDGYATSFSFKRVKGEARPSVTLEHITRSQLQQYRVWGVDPGVDEVFVVADGCSMDNGIYSATPPPSPAATHAPRRR